MNTDNSQNTHYVCPKCSNTTYESGQIRAAGGFWTKIFDIQNRKLITISCQRCGYTELYNAKKTKTAENILDFFTG